MHFKVNDLTFSGDKFNRKVDYDLEQVLKNEIKRIYGSFFVSTRMASCPRCTLRRGNYFEAILQLRGGRDNNLEEVFKFSMMQLDEPSNEEVFLTKADRKKEGYDLYVSDKQFTRNLGKKIIDNFGGIYVETSHLVGKKEGRDLYRITVSVRIPEFVAGDVIKSKGKMLLIQKIRGNDVQVIDLSDYTSLKVKLGDLKDHLLLQRSEGILEAQILYREGDTVYILDPYDFKEKAIYDPKKRKSIYVMKNEDELVVIPKD